MNRDSDPGVKLTAVTERVTCVPVDTDVAKATVAFPVDIPEGNKILVEAGGPPLHKFSHVINVVVALDVPKETSNGTVPPGPLTTPNTNPTELLGLLAVNPRALIIACAVADESSPISNVLAAVIPLTSTYTAELEWFTELPTSEFAIEAAATSVLGGTDTLAVVNRIGETTGLLRNCNVASLDAEKTSLGINCV
jgi:hypothetical protein